MSFIYRLENITVPDLRTIILQFGYPISNISKNDLNIFPVISEIPIPEILDLIIQDNEVTLTVNPLWPRKQYKVEVLFFPKETNENIFSFVSPEDPNNTVRSSMIQRLSNNIYNLEQGTLVRDVIDVESEDILISSRSVRETKNQNYLSFYVENEFKIRGDGPFDRLNEESAYQIVRVSKQPIGTFISGSLNFEAFPSTPIPLNQESIVDEEIDLSNFKSLIITTKNYPITKLNNFYISYQNGDYFEYAISQYSYQLQDPKYDELAKTYLLLNNNQIKLNEEILNLDNFRLPISGDKIYVSYNFKHEGKEISSENLLVYELLSSAREPVPPITTQFDLKFNSIVSEQDQIITSNGVQFLDPNSNPPFSIVHPAFKKEIVFNVERPPIVPGEYSVDYSSGRVFVYGAETNDGTGDFPPGASYFYRSKFSINLDYNVDFITQELVANPVRDLISKNATISFQFQQNLIENKDYFAPLHQEILNERIDNRLTSNQSLKVKNIPITNVFRIYNETSGEVYRVSRWNDNTIYFTSNFPPNIISSNQERVKFRSIFNEPLVSFSEITGFILPIIKFDLQFDLLSNASEDGLGSSINSSLEFINSEIFKKERFFDSALDLSLNLSYLNSENDFMVDYVNGKIYLAISTPPTNYDFGSINYKRIEVQTDHVHITSVSNLYFSSNQEITETVFYSSFSDNFVQPSSYFLSAERFFDSGLPYIVENNKIFVQDNIFELRGIYDHYQISNQTIRLNFAPIAEFNFNTITLNASGLQQFSELIISGTLTLSLPFYSAGIDYISVGSIVRVSDNAELQGILQPNGQIILDGTNSPLPGENVRVVFYVGLNGGATPVVDYSRGEYYIDYDYLADEILVSYEYGDNQIDFSASSILAPGENYYCSYFVGALRETLLSNFGGLVNIPILNSFDTSLERERYRDAIAGVLQAFPKGPIIQAIKKLVNKITHVDPIIIEALFNLWSLGEGQLYSRPASTFGSPQLVQGKNNFGLLLKQGDYISLPATSHLSLEEGTLEFWFTPQWKGLDNLAEMTFQLLFDDNFISNDKVFIGSGSISPEFDLEQKFYLSYDKKYEGLPGKIFTEPFGVFIYFDIDLQRWKLLCKSSINETHKFSGNIETFGEFYAVEGISGLLEIGDVLRTTQKKIEFEFYIDAQDGYSSDGYQSAQDGYLSGYSFDGLQFCADQNYYLVDLGNKNEPNQNRLSIYRDGRGYLNFRILSNEKKFGEFKLSADVSNWKKNESHFIAASWKLNTIEKKDEMHLFIDGQEVPNLLQYGGRPKATLNDIFRKVSPEILLGPILRPIIGGNDLSTSFNSPVVMSSSFDFSALGILPGDTISILEDGFGTYNILSVNQSILILTSNLPAPLSQAKFSINSFSSIVNSSLDLVTNFSVSVIHNDNSETELFGLRTTNPDYSFQKNIFNQNILTILNGVDIGETIAIRTFGLSYRRFSDQQYLWGNSSVLKTELPPPINLDEVDIIKIILEPYQILPTNSTIILSSFQSTTAINYLPTNTIEGRQIKVFLSGQNVDFSYAVNIVVFGSDTGGPTSEIFSFTSTEPQISVTKFISFSSVQVTVQVWDTSKPGPVIRIEEAYSLINSNGNNIYPVIRYSLQSGSGENLNSLSLTTAQDATREFFAARIGEKIIISSPLSVAGTYEIVSVINSQTIEVSPSFPISFVNGNYKLYQVLDSRSGFQNGFFLFETAGEIAVPYILNKGYYKFNYPTNLSIPFKSFNGKEELLIGTNLERNFYSEGVIDNFIILSQMLLDVRRGEQTSNRNITSDYFNFLPPPNTKQTLTYLNFDQFPPTDQSINYISYDKNFLQSHESINSEFTSSVVIDSRPLKFENIGYLNKNQGTIEFWISPMTDTANDSEIRYYFDASSLVTESVKNVSKSQIKINGLASKILAIQTSNGDRVDQRYILSQDHQTINLEIPLPYQQMDLEVIYLPIGLIGNRLSLYKDPFGFLVFEFRMQDEIFAIRRPIFWERNTWHRVMMIYSCNSKNHSDNIRLFVDGEEKANFIFGTGILFGSGAVFGETNEVSGGLKADMNFLDPINEFFIGSNYEERFLAQARFDNIRISNIARTPKIIAGQAKDLNYSSNLSNCFPVIEDLYTTLLLNFDTLTSKAKDFALLKNSNYGLSSFEIQVIDSFDIVSSSSKVKEILETLILLLKPAECKVTITYI